MIMLITVLCLNDTGGGPYYAQGPDTAAAPTSPVTAETTAPETPTPTPVRDEIGSTGYLKIKASYSDNSIFEENVSINAEDMTKSSEFEAIVNAVRSAEREQDIFAAARLTLQKNGRDTELTKKINIYVEITEEFSDYESISVFRTEAPEAVTKIEAEEADGYITFSTDKMGVFVFTGVPGGGGISRAARRKCGRNGLRHTHGGGRYGQRRKRDNFTGSFCFMAADSACGRNRSRHGDRLRNVGQIQNETG